MGRLFVSCLAMLALPLSGCAVVSATGSVIGAAGTLVSVTAKTTAGAIDALAGGGDEKKSDCADKDKGEDCDQPASSK